MAEGVTGKKEQQKNKKSKQNEKKKHQQNGLKNVKPIPTSNAGQKKKNKSNKHNLKFERKSDSFLRKIFKLLYLLTVGFFIVAGFLYIVDYEKFSQLKSRAGVMVNNVVILLPENVVTAGGKVGEFTRPIAEVTVEKSKIVINHMSGFLNTNPVIKDHWINIREISSICGSRITDYFRTLYLAVTGFCNKLIS